MGIVRTFPDRRRQLCTVHIWQPQVEQNQVGRSSRKDLQSLGAGARFNQVVRFHWNAGSDETPDRLLVFHHAYERLTAQRALPEPGRWAVPR